MTKLRNIAFLLATLLLLTNCAKRGFITGGEKDTLAPKIVNSNPDNFSTNFKGNEIKINFDELIKVKDINKQLIISPPMKKQPIIVPQGSASKYISIKILDTLAPNTTYSFNFGQSITDNNEGNPYSQFKYVAATSDDLLFGKGSEGYNKLSTPVFIFGTGIKSSISKELYVISSIDLNIVNYDFLDVVHNYNDKSQRIEIIGLNAEFKIGIFFTINNSESKNNQKGKKKNSNPGTFDHLPFAR